MPWIIDYPIVLEEMRRLKLRSLYYNSGAFGFHGDVVTRSLGWIGPPDETIQAEAKPLVRQAPRPFEQSLARLLVCAWEQILPGRIWVMPASHWAYELDLGSREWLPPLLEHVGIDPGLLQGRSTAAAIEFGPEESSLLEHFIFRLLEMLQASDFAIAFPHHRVTCMLHHHKQLWWTTSQSDMADALENLLKPHQE